VVIGKVGHRNFFSETEWCKIVTAGAFVLCAKKVGEIDPRGGQSTARS